MLLSRIHERKSRRNGYGYIGLSRNERPHQVIRWKKFSDRQKLQMENRMGKIIRFAN